MNHLPKTLALACSCALISCKKENSNRWTEVTIEVKDPFTNEPLNEILFQIRGVKSYETQSFDHQGTFYPTDGHISYGFKGKNNYNYWIDFNDYGYYNLGDKDPRITIGQSNHFNISLVKYGHLSIYIENVDCVYNDSLYWRVNYLDDSEYESPDYYWLNNWSGCYGLEHAVNRDVPKGYYEFEWRLKEANGNESEGSEIILVNESNASVYIFQY